VTNFYFFIFLTRQGLTLVLRISKENQGSRSSNFKS